MTKHTFWCKDGIYQLVYTVDENNIIIGHMFELQ